MYTLAVAKAQIFAWPQPWILLFPEIIYLVLFSVQKCIEIPGMDKKNSRKNFYIENLEPEEKSRKNILATPNVITLSLVFSDSIQFSINRSTD